MSFTIPPATRVDGQAGIVDDLNDAYAALAAIAGLNVQDSVYGGGADPTGATYSDAAFTAAAAAAATSGGMVYLPPGNYKTQNPVTAQLRVSFIGGGKSNTTWSYEGTGDCLRIYSITGYNTTPGAVIGITFDGTNSVAPATGLHYGDVVQGELNCGIQHFNGAGSIGLHVDNSLFYTEMLHGNVYVLDNSTGVVFDVTGSGYNSFARPYLNIWLDAKAGQQGVILQNGAYIYGGHLGIYGNMNYASSAPTPLNAALTVTGNGSTVNCTPDQYSRIWHTHIDIDVETTAGASTPQTIVWGDLNNNQIIGYGNINFSAYQAFTVSNWTSDYPDAFEFIGTIYGDGNLSGVGGGNKTGGLVSTAPLRQAPVSKGTLSAPLTNSTTMTQIGQWTIPASNVQAHSRLKLVAFGRASSAAASPGTLQFLLQVNGLTVSSFGLVSLPVSLSDAPWVVELILDFPSVGASASMYGKGSWGANQIGGDITTDVLNDVRRQTIDSTVAMGVKILAQFSVASASNSVVVDDGTLTREAF